MKAKEFDKIFDDGGDIMAHADLSAATRPNRQVKRVNVDFPLWMLNSLDHEATRLGVTRQALVKVWIAHCLRHEVPAG